MTPSSRPLVRWTLLLLGVPQLVYWLGALLNQIAVAANRGLMPVWYAPCAIGHEGQVINGVRVLDDMHSCLTASSNFILLCDWINLHASILSPGDVLLNLGDLITGPAFWMWMAYVLYRAASPKPLYKLSGPSK
jgi:hypothetical protein